MMQFIVSVVLLILMFLWLRRAVTKELGKTRQTESQILAQRLQELLEVQTQLHDAHMALIAKEQGRLFDQKLLKETMDRLDRYRRVLEAVLRSQGCAEAKIMEVILKTDNDEPLE